MILILLFMSDFWFGVVNLKNAKHLKKVKWKIEPISTEWCIIASVVYNMRLLRLFSSKYYALKLDIVQHLREYLVILSQKIMHEDLI